MLHSNKLCNSWHAVNHRYARTQATTAMAGRDIHSNIKCLKSKCVIYFICSLINFYYTIWIASRFHVYLIQKSGKCSSMCIIYADRCAWLKNSHKLFISAPILILIRPLKLLDDSTSIWYSTDNHYFATSLQVPLPYQKWV